ncbi:MAG TPA: hypothetical protein VK721_06165 [Solirubrobacteraceae bacterium]|nr:hypothetical protein [Solirubrobacteraceae bacterium]
MREAGGLIDLPGVPLVENYQPRQVVEREYGAVSEQDMVDALRAADVPLRGRSFRERMMGVAAGAPTRMRESLAALVEKTEEARAKAARALEVDETVAADDVDSADLLQLQGVPMVEAANAAPLTGKETLAKVKAEENEEAELRESGLPTYGGAAFGTPEVEYDDGSAYELISELYALLPNQHGENGPSLENGQIEDLARTVLGGKPLSGLQYGVLKQLAAKYADELEAARASGDSSQDYMSVPDPASGRLVTTPGHSNTAGSAAGRLAA